MKVKAKHWLKYNGTWYQGGDEFEISAADAGDLEEMVEIAETPVHTEPAAESEAQPKRRGRRKTAESAED